MRMPGDNGEPRAVPGSRLLPTDRTAALQSGSPPGVRRVPAFAAFATFPTFALVRAVSPYFRTFFAASTTFCSSSAGIS
jgi:hypothetical protein